MADAGGIEVRPDRQLLAINAFARHSGGVHSNGRNERSRRIGQVGRTRPPASGSAPSRSSRPTPTNWRRKFMIGCRSSSRPATTSAG